MDGDSGAVTSDATMEEVEDGGGEEEERYRCGSCSALFHSLGEFMDHRNYGCCPGQYRFLFGESAYKSTGRLPEILTSNTWCVKMDYLVCAVIMKSECSIMNIVLASSARDTESKY